jgi:hypothetical protein
MQKVGSSSHIKDMAAQELENTDPETLSVWVLQQQAIQAPLAKGHLSMLLTNIATGCEYLMLSGLPLCKTRWNIIFALWSTDELTSTYYLSRQIRGVGSAKGKCRNAWYSNSAPHDLMSVSERALGSDCAFGACRQTSQYTAPGPLLPLLLDSCLITLAFDAPAPRRSLFCLAF